VILLAEWEEFAEEKKDATINAITKTLTEKTWPVRVSDYSGPISPLCTGRAVNILCMQNSSLGVNTLGFWHS
jgi:hypothetical protein